MLKAWESVWLDLGSVTLLSKTELLELLLPAGAAAAAEEEETSSCEALRVARTSWGFLTTPKKVMCRLLRTTPNNNAVARRVKTIIVMSL
jgi:hypothetical protein